MKLSSKLDTLQELTRQCPEDPHALYLIGLLAEHAEEEKMTSMFLERVEAMVKGEGKTRACRTTYHQMTLSFDVNHGGKIITLL